MAAFTYNVIILPLFITWFIPVSIRDPKTGRFKGFWNLDFVVAFSGLIFSQCYAMISKFGVTPMSTLKIVICVITGIVLGILYVYLTNQKMFGTKFEMKLKS